MHREELLEWLKEYMVDHPTSIDKLAKKMDIGWKTLDGFWKGKKETSLEVLLKIERFLRDSE